MLVLRYISFHGGILFQKDRFPKGKLESQNVNLYTHLNIHYWTTFPKDSLGGPGNASINVFHKYFGTMTVHQAHPEILGPSTVA